MLSAFICRLSKHKVNRRRVWNDKLDFRTTCERCDAELLRDHAGWRRFDEVGDRNPSRDGHPRLR